jgi:energy-converting hydrogenase Eha subunit C
MMDHIRHWLAAIGLTFTGAAAIVSWLPAVDMILRIALSVAGLIVARASYRYYTSNTKK